MGSRRMAKVSEAIREIVSTTVLFELKDPRVKNVTVLRAEVSADLRHAKVYVSVMGDDKTRALSMHGLASARGFIQSKLADRLQIRYTPVLSFVLDPGARLAAQTSALLRDVLPPDQARTQDEAATGSLDGLDGAAPHHDDGLHQPGAASDAAEDSLPAR